MKQSLRWIGGILLAAVIIYFGASWIYAQRLTRARPSLVGAAPRDFPYPVESIQFQTNDSQLIYGWLVTAEEDPLTPNPAPAAGRAESRKAIVLLHGWGGNRKQMLRRARYFREQGYTALLYDARACGESTGDCVTFGYRERADLIAALDFLKKRGYSDIACLGMSQGGATICFAAEELRDVRCVVLESVYDDMNHAVDRRMRRYTGVPGWLGGAAMVPFAEQRLALSINDVSPVQCIAKLPCPVLVVGGEKDQHAWPEDVRRLFAAAPEPKELWMIPEAPHEDLFRYPGYQDKVLTFLTRHMPQGK